MYALQILHIGTFSDTANICLLFFVCFVDMSKYILESET